jgi:predicted small secreted protein
LERGPDGNVRPVSFWQHGRAPGAGCGRSDGTARIKPHHFRLESFMTRSRLLFVALLAVLALSACHTIAGVGKDVKSVGGAVEDAGNTR